MLNNLIVVFNMFVNERQVNYRRFQILLCLHKSLRQNETELISRQANFNVNCRNEYLGE